MRLRTIRLVISSGTYSPASMYCLAFTPRSVPSETLNRKMSPVEIAGTPKRSATTLAWVPLPAPGGPIRMSLMSAQESFVVALLELGLDLLHGVERDTDHDQQRGAAEREVLVGLNPDERDQRDQGQQTQVQSAGQRDAGEDVVEVRLGRLSRPDPGDETAVLLHVVRDLLWVEGDRDVEVGEEDDQQEVGQHVQRVVTPDEVPLDPDQDLVGRSLVELHGHGRQVEQARGEDDRDDAGLVHLERDGRRRAAENLPPDHPAGRCARG